jgi:hypothetical protein
MKNHVLRPLWVAIVFIALVLAARYVMVPDDFGVHGESFTYNYYRAGNVDEWKAYPVSYLGSGVCVDCHSENSDKMASSPHAIIPCENCHGPGRQHPETEDPAAMVIDRSRLLCISCHADLQYTDTNRANIPGINPIEHNAGSECVECHDPHNPDLEDM